MADFKINVIVNPNQAVAGAKKVEKQLVRTGKVADKTRQLIGRVFAFTAIAAGLRATIGLLANFEQQMSTVRAISGAVGQQFDDLREKAKQLGISTRFSATEAADGMVFLARAGFDTNQVLDTIGGTLLLAQAGALGLKEAADIASNVLKGFRLEVDQTGRVVDVLALAANSANTTVGQLGQGLKFVAPIAAGMGVALEETTAAMAALSNAGLQSTLAGTGLRRVLSELESPADKTKKILASVGLTEDDVRISTVGLTAAVENLAKAGVDTGQALELFGDRGGPAFEVLSSSIGDVKQMTGELQNAEGTAKRIATIMDDNLNGALLSVRSAFQGLVIELGDAGATGALRAFFDAVAAGTRTLAANVDVIIKVFDVLAVVLAVKLARKAIPAAIAGLTRLKIAILTNPIGILATAIAAVTAALFIFSDKIPIAADRLATLEDVGVAAFEAIQPEVDALVETFEKGFPLISSLVAKVFGDVELSIEGALRVSARAIDTIVGLWKGGFNAILVIFGDLPASMEILFVRTFNLALRNLTFFLNKAITAINFVREALGKVPIEMVEAFQLSAGKPAEEIGVKIDQAIAKGLDSSTAAEDALDRVLNRAEEIAALQGIFDDEAFAGAPRRPDKITPKAGAGTAGATGTPTKIDTEFEKLIEGLRNEADLLKLSSREREIRAQILSAEATLERDLTAAEREQVTALVTINQSLADQATLLDSIRDPQETYARGIEAVNALLAKNAINSREAAIAKRDLDIALLNTETTIAAGFERGFLKAQKSIEDFSVRSEQLISDAFREAQNTLVNFFKTGKFEAEDFFRSIGDNLLQLAAQQALAAAFGQNNGGGFLGGSTSGGGGNGTAQGIGGLIAQGITSYFSSGSGFQNGGSFLVGQGTAQARIPGIDNRLVAFKAQDGETVTVTPKNENGAGKGVVNQVWNITTPDADSFQRSQTQVQNKANAGLSRARARR